ncbi:hypothetical protein [Streptomyces sp. NPDC001675]
MPTAPRAVWYAVLGTASGVVLAVAGTVCPSWRDASSVPASGAVAVEVGQECESLVPAETEVSCGTTAFGDLRYNCPSGASESCPPTREVTVRNTGEATVRVSVVSGSTPGERYETSPCMLKETDAVVLQPAPGERYLYDIVLTTADERPSVVTVIGIR